MFGTRDKRRRFGSVGIAALVSVATSLAHCGTSSSEASPPPSNGPSSTASDAASSNDSPARAATEDASACTTCDATTAADASPSPFVAIFSAFPAEMAPLLAKTAVQSTTTVNGHTFSVGVLEGKRVVLGLTGMGLANATATSKAVLAQFPVKGVIFSSVAGSKLRIGDVTVPTSWSLKGATTFVPDATWLQLTNAMIAQGAPCLEKCTAVPATGVLVCMGHTPAVFVGGSGNSEEVSVPLACQPAGDDVFGCEVGAPAGVGAKCEATIAPAADAGAGAEVTDNETGAVAAEAAARGVPFIAFRGVSDGAGDPLSLPGYPTQFFAYYRLAARNAAATTAAFVAHLK